MNTFYTSITLVSDTWLVAGYIREEREHVYDQGLHLMDTSAESIRTTYFKISTPSLYNQQGGPWTLHSGESTSYDPKPRESFSRSRQDGLIVALAQNYNTQAGQISACCITMPISELLERGKKGKDRFKWEEWERDVYASVLKFQLHPQPWEGNPTKLEVKFVDDLSILHFVCESSH